MKVSNTIHTDKKYHTLEAFRFVKTISGFEIDLIE